MKKNSISVFISFTLIFLLGLDCTYAQNEFYNNGSSITVQSGALIAVQGEVINTNSGANIGLVSNSGLISFSGNWTNNSTSGALIATTGSVDMIGAAQTITGSQPTRFNNLNLLGSGIKTLNVNTFVSGTTGVLALGSRPLDLNSNTLFVTNPIVGAITRTTGYIISETTPIPGYGIIQWNIGNAATGNYIFPFGTLAATYIPFTLNITTPGVQSSTGAISASTYPTITSPALNNRPLPTGVNNLNNNCNTEHATKMLDRFWVINTSNYSTSPVANKQFTYIDNEWDLTGGSANLINENDLQAWYYNMAWTHLPGTNNSNTNTQNISGNANYGVFTLGDYKELNLQLLNVDSVICFGESNGIITFTSNVGYGSPTYSLNTNSISSNTISSLAAGTYTVRGMDIMGCIDTLLSIKVKQPDKLVLTLASDTNSICKNDSILLTSGFTGGTKPYTLNWSTGSINSGIVAASLTKYDAPQSTVKYWIDLTDKNNCIIHSDTVKVTVNPLPDVDFAGPAEGCQPLEVNFTNLTSSTPTITSWLWSFGTGEVSTSASPSYTYTFPGTFSVSLSAISDKGCKQVVGKSNYVVVHLKPKANFYYTPPFGIDILNPEVLFQNTSVGFDNSTWNFNDGSAVSNETNSLHTYADTGVYQIKLIVSTIHNCSDSLTIPLKVNEISTLYVPNAFTPDGNSLNDVFTPSGLDLYDFKMMIFDRWGEKIFESSIANEGWDGKYRGAMCKEGVYVYKIEFKPINGPVKRRAQIITGHVSLLHAAR